MTPKTGFDAAMLRARHMLRLYELICDTRKYNVRKDWEATFKQVMHWPDKEAIVRVDGKDKASILVLREKCNIGREQFAHDYVSELLRGAVVASVSALDRYLHDLIVKHSWKLLNRREEEIPKCLKSLSISTLDAKKALEHLRKNSASRPGHLIKQAVQERLHREYTFQNPDSVLAAAKMLGVEDFWTKVSARMPGKPTNGEVIKMLRKIALRRNQIVHEADLIRTRRADAALRDISHSDAIAWVEWMEGFGSAIQEVVDQSV